MSTEENSTRDKTSPTACAVCGSTSLQVFFEQQDMPVFCNALWPDREQAVGCARGDMTLAFCRNCGFIANRTFDPRRLDYSPEYENSLHYSARFQDYAKTLAQRLVDDNNLYGKNIIEIGCGKGDFLMMLCRLGDNRGVGFDRSYVDREEHKQAGVDVRFVQDFYSDKYADYPADLVCCRHVLEHIEQPISFLADLRRIIGDRDGAAIYFEVPNSLHTFCNLAVWDIIYEHPNYFVPVSLANAFQRTGFVVREVRTEFSDQFLSLTAAPCATDQPAATPGSTEVQRLSDELTAFSNRYRAKRAEWVAVFDRLAHDNQKAVIWGSGSKGVTFLNTLNLKEQVEYAVDINPRKQGMYVAGTGQKIVGPETVKDYKPDLVVIMNPLYKDEIRETTADLGLSPRFLTV